MLALLLIAALQGPQPFPASAVAELRGGWRFTSGDSAVYARPGYHDAEWRAIEVPGTWGRGGIPALRGFGWYRFHYSVDSVPPEPLGVRFAGVTGAFEAFVDGRRMGGTGEFPPHYGARSLVAVVLSLPLEAVTRGEHVLAVRVYSNERVGGITELVQAGPLEELQAEGFRVSAFIIGVALLVIGLSIHQVLYWARRPEAMEHLYLFVFAASLGVMFLMWEPQLRRTLSPSLDWYRLYLLFAGAAAAFFLFAFRRLFEVDFARVVGGLGAVFGAVGVSALLLPGWTELRFVGTHAFNPLILLTCVLAAALLVQQVRRGVEHAKALLWGLAIIGLTVLHDVAVEWGLLGSPSGVLWTHVGAVAFVTSLAYVTARQFVDTASIALNDRLTGLYRREIVVDALYREIRRAARTHQSLAVVMMDLDNFKAVNDSHGHQAGDRVLAEVGRRLATAGRAVDWLGRYGGEEFLAVLADSDVPGGEQAAERFRQAVAALPIDVGRAPRLITLSAGVASYDGGSEWPTPEQLIGAADAALYRAKAGGKNMVRS
jgi:diguanylate cyclase (GGDEF)-like protein